MKNFTFSGPLSDALEKFVTERRGIGYCYNVQAKELVRFDTFTMNLFCEKNVLSKEIVEAWISKRPNEKLSNQRVRIQLFQQLGRFMLRYGYTAYVPLSNTTQRTVPKYAPHIFTDTELSALFKQADQCVQKLWTSKRHLIIPLLFRMLYGCGLRLSEALSLVVRDVDLEKGILTIRNSKFNKERLVPMAPSLTERCRVYSRLVHSFSPADAVFLPTPDNKVYSAGFIYRVYRELLWQAGISHGGKGHGPRIHDFRHTFAVHCLRQWVLNDVDLKAALPVLSAYLGHSSIQATQYYLRLTAELFPQITTALETKYGDCIPILGGDIFEAN